MIIKRDFHFDKNALISYYENLQEFIGRKFTQSKIASLLKKQNPDSKYYNAMDRKFNTLKFYGFVYFNDDDEFSFNENFEEYVACLKEDRDTYKSFLKILLSSKFQYYNNSNTNFFELLISLLEDKSILYLDHIDMILYLQNFELVNDRSELRQLVKSSKNKSFADKVKLLEDFYEEHGLGNIAVPVHDMSYLFTFLVNNGFYTTKNSLQSKKYYQGKTKTPRILKDRRLYLSEQLLDHINGHEYEAIVDEIEYNSELEDGLYKDPDKDISKLINKSEETDKTIVKRYKTDTKLRNNALDKSGYICEIGKLKGMECKTFPSRRYEGDYAEVHHLIPMHVQEDDLFVQEDKLISLDQISNLIVLCPTCHSKLHYGKSSDVKPDLELLFEYRKEALIQNELILKIEELLEFYKI
tara:strand:- start:354 stop:1589 length:1236 start_codon:yes stop_codon:yes gene_type:complete